MRLPTDTPIDLDRAQAQRQALIELANPDYRTAQPTWLERVIDWIMRHGSGLATRASDAAPGGWWGIAGLAIVIVAAVVVIRWRIGPLAHTNRMAFRVDPAISAAQYRRHANELAEEQRWAEAISERMRAIVRGCEERGFVEPRPGRTADELAREVSSVIPQVSDALSTAAEVFDRVRYGRRPGDLDGYSTLAQADDVVTNANRPWLARS